MKNQSLKTLRKKSNNMKWHDFIFSDDPRLRWRRHIIFWLAWLIYFAGTFFYKQQPFIKDGLALWIILILIKSIFILIGHAFICYITMYFLLPWFLLKGKYFSFSFVLLTAGIVVTAWTYLCYALFFPLLEKVFNSPAAIAGNVLLWTSLLTGLLSSLKVVAAAVTIKLLKRWWQKQNENMQLEKEKINVELQLLKAQIHPDFLFSSLDKIYHFAQVDSGKAASLLLKLSDLLSYMLYESNQPQVLLEKELKMTRNYLELEKKRLGDQLDIDFQVKGNPADKMIAPLLLLPFIENCFQYCENKSLEKYWLNLDIRITETELLLKLVNGKPADEKINPLLVEAGLANVQKRLAIIYRDRYELKLTVEPDYMITLLKMQLDKIEGLAEGFIRTDEKSNGQNHFPAYANI
jgi:sensor histidine kinase YesM